MLKQAKASPDIDNYLCFLLSGQMSPSAVALKPDNLLAARSAAGIMLKNDIRTHYQSIPETTQSYIRSNILLGLRDLSAQIRNLAGNVVTEVVRQAGVAGWPEVFSDLLSMISNENGTTPPEAQEGAMSALLKVCEDNKKALGKVYRSQIPLDTIIPRLLDFTSSPLPKVRANAIASLNIFIPEKSVSLMSNLNTFLTRLFDLANDTSNDVRKQICRAIVQIAEVAPAKIAPHMDGLVTYMVTQQRNVDNDELALDAAEFWLCVGEDENLRNSLGPHLPKIVPVLLESMVYSEDDVLRLESEAEDAELEDREEDIKPQFAKSKSARAANSANGQAKGLGISVTPNGNTYGDDDLSEGELEELGEDEMGDDPEDQWNLRKCSAAALDVLASVFHQPVFETTLPYLKVNLTHAEWPMREAAVLAIGAIADGCMEVVGPHLPDIIPFLITLLQDPEPVVRQITCWSLGRYSAWASHLDSAGKERFFLPMMDGILKRMLDNNKRVQEAAASAFANLEEKANKELENPEYCEVIARQFAECFAKYKDRNMFVLYDCVQTLAENVGPTLQSPELVHSLMPALLKRWEKVPDQSREMIPLLECLSYVAAALGNTFSPYAGPIFNRCVKIIYQNLKDSLAAVENPALDVPEQDFLVTSLDLVSAIIQALGADQSAQMVRGPQPSILDLLPVCLEDPNGEVRQSAYALLGDCAMHIFTELEPSLKTILPILVSALDLSKASAAAEATGYAVLNNACWSCGEISMRAQQNMGPFVETILQRFYTILCSEKIPSSLHENASIALGRLAISCAEIMAPHLSLFAPLFLNAMKSISWTDEKLHAMKGMSQVVLLNPQGLAQCLPEFMIQIAQSPSYPSISAERGGTYELFQQVHAPRLDGLDQHRLIQQQILTLYKQNIPDFDIFLHQNLPPESERNLREMYVI